MKIVNFEQGQRSEVWHKWRNDGIGASDISVLMETNPYKTERTLFEEKYGYSEPFINKAMLHGIENESRVLEWVNNEKGLNLKPICIEDVNNHQFKASLDGFDMEKKVLCEIKCPTSEKVLENIRQNGTVPEYWISQVQWQIMLCNPTEAFFAVWDSKEDACYILTVFSDPSVQKKMREKATEFCRKLNLGLLPAPSEKDYIDMGDNKQLKKFLDIYDQFGVQEKIIKQEKKNLKEDIEKITNGRNARCGEYSIIRFSARTTYDFEAMRQDGIDVEKYAKKSSNDSFRISKKNNKS